ncbi:MAG: SCP2 sterol-binding domain-containing protein, partial [Proteobacteria bacterium]|nr:SCP2 sterol-binding domain-containing protein [Pseudomonadota bacterium]
MFYSLLEKAINHVLEQDPDTAYHLEALDGKVVKIHLTDWHIDCFIRVEQKKLRLFKDFPGQADTLIQGTTTGMVKAACSGVSGAALFEQGIQIEGDIQLGEQIRD